MLCPTGEHLHRQIAFCATLSLIGIKLFQISKNSVVLELKYRRLSQEGLTFATHTYIRFWLACVCVWAKELITHADTTKDTG